MRKLSFYLFVSFATLILLGVLVYYAMGIFHLVTPFSQSPVGANLLVNANFDNGIANGWTTDNPDHVFFDNNGNGAKPTVQTSIKLLATSEDVHLFSPQVHIDSAKTYEIESYINVKQITSGAFAYYIDEYNNKGKWISGELKIPQVTAIRGIVAFPYIPTSADVASARLQVIIPRNSNIVAYVDSMNWHQE